MSHRPRSAVADRLERMYLRDGDILARSVPDGFLLHLQHRIEQTDHYVIELFYLSVQSRHLAESKQYLAFACEHVSNVSFCMACARACPEPVHSHLESQSISRNDLLLELCILYSPENSQLAFVFRHGKHRDAACLRQRLDDEDSGHYRSARKMSHENSTRLPSRI